ncbi:hypothetical protein BGZ95_011534 [Linnemannia exigua]|uniref:BZIP domain-containing protein n=1 Tax=Linnemannia exigua TaxID=604196 RepID=A0AAD4DLB6_9FUNG|nr:hypothetical protein BGZ95_011534 [Linnemannia exigua]
MSNPMFDDFIELDLLDASDPANAMFASFYLGDTADIHDDNDINNLAPVIDSTATSTSMTAPSAAETDDAAILGLVIKTEPSDSPMLLNPIPLSPQQSLASDESPLIFDSDMTLITPDQLTIAPQATTVSPSSLSTSSIAAVATISTAAATASSASAQSAVAINSSKTPKSTAAAIASPSAETTARSSPSSTPTSPASPASTSTAKRASPEPATSPARKHAKTDSISSSKAKSSSASKKSSSSAPTPSNAAAAPKASGAAKPTASTSAAASSTSTTSTSTTSSSSTKGKAQTPDPSAESLTSTANTTLSAATLQFLLQQQVETPLIPQLFTGKLTREEIEETLARLLESTKYLIPTSDEEAPVKIKEEPVSDEESDNEMEGVEPTSTTDGAEPSHGLKTQPGIKTDDIPSSTDLKKMTSKERRQLRNKISARNFRVRRKEYIYTLEGQVLQHKTEARHLREAVTLMQDENRRLKDELESVRRQMEATTLTPSTINTATFAPTSTDPMLSPEPSMPLSRENQSLLTSIMNRNVNAAMNPNAKSNITLTMARPQSPILTPNLHKDVPNSSSGSASQSSWKDKNPIMVHRTLIPEVCFGDEFQFDSKPSSAFDAPEMDRPWMTFDSKPAEPQLIGAPFTVSELVVELMQTFTCMSANMSSSLTESTTEGEPFAETDSEAALDWELQQNLWALTQVEEEDEMTEEQIQLVYDLVQCQASTSTSRPSSPMQEDPNMIEWLYESMMARLVDLDLQDSQLSTLAKSHMA